MVRMQEMGSPPEEVMGEMPEGLVSRARRVCVGAGSWEPNSSALCLNLLLVGIRRGRRVYDHVIGARGWRGGELGQGMPSDTEAASCDTTNTFLCPGEHEQRRGSRLGIYTRLY